MRRSLLFTIAALVACDSAPPSPPAKPANQTEIQTITTVRPVPATLDPPPMLQDEAPPPKAVPSQSQAPVAFSAEDDRLRASLPFTPAIAMDPIDGSKISIRATTPTLEYKGKIYYFANDVNKKIFSGNPEHVLKGGYLRM